MCHASLGDFGLTFVYAGHAGANEFNQIVIVNSLENAHSLSINYFSSVVIQLTVFSNLSNPFASTDSTTRRFRVVQAGCGKLLKQLESSRDEARARLQLHSYWLSQFH
ncbi:hypothetical protein CUMW_056850 [Citrus unshiu]|nr:hypothetical protein CUMW_056850 [Citrus unshiu]